MLACSPSKRNILEKKRGNEIDIPGVSVIGHAHQMPPQMKHVSRHIDAAYRLHADAVLVMKSLYSIGKITGRGITVASVKIGHQDCVTRLAQQIVQRVGAGTHEFMLTSAQLETQVAWRYSPGADDAGGAYIDTFASKSGLKVTVQ